MSPKGRQTPVTLSEIDEIALLQAIDEFNDQKRAKFLKKYDFSRSSKFYLIHEQRLYDTKALVSAAYRHATGKRRPTRQTVCAQRWLAIWMSHMNELSVTFG